MDREIKHRGYSINHKILVYGTLVNCHRTNKWFILDNVTVDSRLNPEFDNYDLFEVDYESISIFTGVKDVNCADIYEGDIVRNFAIFDKVIFKKGIFTTLKSTEDKFKCKQPLAVHKDLKVIGNIYENPELLEEKK